MPLLIRGNHEVSERVQNASLDLSNRGTRSAALCIIKAVDTGRVLVVERFKDGQVGFPCGKIESGELAREAALRELHEETGITKNDLSTELVFIQGILFEGCNVSVYQAYVREEKPTCAIMGFEDETKPFWMTPDELADTESAFQSFNIVAMYNTGLIL